MKSYFKISFIILAIKTAYAYKRSSIVAALDALSFKSLLNRQKEKAFTSCYCKTAQRYGQLEIKTNQFLADNFTLFS